EFRRAAPRDLRLPAGTRPEDAGAGHRPHSRRDRTPGRLHGLADARAAHPPGEGDVEHLHERVAARGRRGDVPVRPRIERTSPCRRGEHPAGSRSRRVDRQDFRLHRTDLPRRAFQRIRGPAQERLSRGPPGPPGKGRPRGPAARPTAPGAPRFRVVRDDGTPHARGRGPIARRAGGLPVSFRQAHWDEPLLMEKRSAPDAPIDVADLVPPKLRREGLAIPNLAEFDVVRHFTRLSQMNFGIDTGFYPLGSCTMKFNPKFTEELAALPTVARIHPDQDEATVQGALRLLYELQGILAKIAGMEAVTLQPAAGAQGEYTGLLLAAAYHRDRGETRNQVILPDTAHGTNFASAGMLGYDIVEIPSKDGRVDLKALEPFLPVPLVSLNGRGYHLDYDRPKSIGKVRAWYGNFALLVRAYAYILRMGGDGLREVSDRAVLNANYVRHRLQGVLDVPFGGLRKHEFVASAASLTAKGIRTVDLAKRLMDFGYHPSTVYFPHLVEEALMIEPTETETKETLDAFVEALTKIVGEDPDVLRSAPQNTAVRRVDEVRAAREPILSARMARAAKAGPS